MNEWGTPATVIAVLTLLGVGSLIPKMITALISWVTGAEKRRRDEAERLRAQLENYQDEVDDETAFRRVLQEALSEHRIFMMTKGIPVHELPPFPGRPSRKKE